MRGTEGAGKSTLLEEVYDRNERTYLIDYVQSSIPLWKKMLKNIIYSEHIFNAINENLRNEVIGLLHSEPPNLIESLKSIFIKLSSSVKFTLLLDDFNRYNEFFLEILTQLIPIFQVNHLKVILTEDSDLLYQSDDINNLREINLTSFTDTNVEEYLEKSFADFFPKEEIKKLILQHADLLPGNIDSFIKDLVLLNVLEFSGSGAEIISNEISINILKSSQEEIYKLRIDDLSAEELQTARILSLFENTLEAKILTAVAAPKNQQMPDIIANLREKNILQQSNISINPMFTSDGIKRLIYSGITNKEALHQNAAEIIENKFPNFSRPNLARQYELANDINSSVRVYKQELDSAEKISALSYKKKILNHLLQLSLNENNKQEIQLELCNVLFRISENKACLELIKEISKESLTEEQNLEISIIEGASLIAVGELEAGEDLLNSLLPKVDDESRKQEIWMDIAYAEFDLNEYENAAQICRQIIENPLSRNEIKGKGYNLLGMVEIYEKNNIDGAVTYFDEAIKMYEQSNLLLRVAGTEVNVGNIFNMKGDYASAEEHWKKSLRINLSIGNLDQEANLLLNFGIYYFEQLNFEKSVEQYKRAYNIFSSLGRKNGQGLVLINLGEVFMESCEFQNSYNSLQKALGIFNQTSNAEEEFETMFMLGKLYFVLGDEAGLSEITSDLKRTIFENPLWEKQKINLEFLEQLRGFNNGNLLQIEEPLEKISAQYLELDERINFAKTLLFLASGLIKHGNYNKALEIINNGKLCEISTKNKMLEAERKYLLGKMSAEHPELRIEPAIEFYREAYNLIKDESITELTWKILFAIAVTYYNRGNIQKAKDFVIYAKSLLLFIADNINDMNLKEIYLKKPERKSAIEKLEELEKQL